jgi:hypothetical protein
VGDQAAPQQVGERNHCNPMADSRVVTMAITPLSGAFEI